MEPIWRKKKIKVKKYVDDNNTVAKVFIKEVPTYQINDRTVKNIRAMESEMLFKHITTRATEQGLRVNNSKTTLLTVSGATSYKASSHIYDEENKRIDSVEKLKTVGFVFNERGDVSSQLGALKSRFRSRTWTLRHLRQTDFSEEELKRFYTTNIRPIVEYSSVVYHSMITKEMSHDLEMQQSRALKNIYGNTYSYSRLLELAGLETLQQRREAACIKFAEKTAANPRFSLWFPRRTTRARSRTQEEFVERRARTERRKKSPLFYFRRMLNSNRLHY